MRFRSINAFVALFYAYDSRLCITCRSLWIDCAIVVWPDALHCKLRTPVSEWCRFRFTTFHLQLVFLCIERDNFLSIVALCRNLVQCRIFLPLFFILFFLPFLFVLKEEPGSNKTTLGKVGSWNLLHIWRVLTSVKDWDLKLKYFSMIKMHLCNDHNLHP
jgi:hypothetical protein